VEAVVGAEFGEERTFGEDFRGGSGDKKFVGVEGVEHFAGLERVELDAEIGMREFGAAHDSLDAFGKGGFGLCMGLRD
jgi:hypothetical protein